MPNLKTNLWRHTAENHKAFTSLNEDKSTNLLIVGGGYTGCSAALEAVTCGEKVVLIEAETIGYGGSGRNVGLVNAGLWTPPEEILKKIGYDKGKKLITALAKAPNLVFDIIETEGISCEAVRNGTLHLAHAPSGMKELEDRYRQGNLVGAPLNILDRDETIERTGSKAFFGSLFDPRAGTIQPLAYCSGLAQAAREKGAQVFEKSRLESLRYDGLHWFASVNGCVVQAECILLATNAYPSAIFGAPNQEFVPVHYSQFATIPLDLELKNHILPGKEGCWDTDMVMTSLRVDKSGRLILGGVGNIEGIGCAIHKKWALRKIEKYFPELTGVPIESSWQGLIAMTSDHLPKVLSFGPKALSIFGYSGRGIGPGTVFGKSAARTLLFDEASSMPIDIKNSYREGLKRVREIYFEFGSILTHALGSIRR